MKNHVDLTQMKDGQKGKVVNIVGGKSLLNRLDTMGIRVGVEVLKISGHPLGGPVVVQVGGSVVAVGHSMARKIIVEKI